MDKPELHELVIFCKLRMPVWMKVRVGQWETDMARMNVCVAVAQSLCCSISSQDKRMSQNYGKQSNHLYMYYSILLKGTAKCIN